MSVVANVAVNLDASKALTALNGLTSKANDAARGIGDAFQGLGTKLQGFGSQISNVSTALAGLGAGAAISGFAKAGIEADRAGKTIKALAGQYGEVDRVQKFASESAKQFGLGQTTASQAVADLYGRLRPMGVSLTDIETTFTGVNKAAGMMNLTAADTEGVMLQLSQAMGSGALQGDELRSIMERLPAVGQAVAKVMGVTVGEVKQLGADGKITTDVIIQAMGELNKLQPPPPDPFKVLGAAMEDLSTSIGTQLMPILVPLAQKIQEVAKRMQELKVGETLARALMPLATTLLGVVDGFLKLDPSIQKAIIQIGAFVAVLSLIAVPVGIVVGALGTIISAVGSVATALAGLQLGAIIAGWAGAIGPAVAGITAALSGLLAWLTGTLLPGLLAFFSGPVGWTVLAVAAVVAMCIAFREPIGRFFEWLGGAIQNGIKVIWQAGEPIRQFWAGVWENAKTAFTNFQSWLNGAWQTIGGAFQNYVVKPLSNAWNGIIGTAKSALRSLLQYIANQINRAGDLINNLIRAYNRLPAPDIPLVPRLTIPAFAQGGVVNGATLAMVGEGGEPEYIIPQSKMAQASMNYLSGARGDSVLSGTPSINVSTGPVMQMDGKQYVTMADLERAMRQTAEGVIGRLRTPSARTALGMR